MKIKKLKVTFSLKRSKEKILIFNFYVDGLLPDDDNFAFIHKLESVYEEIHKDEQEKWDKLQANQAKHLKQAPPKTKPALVKDMTMKEVN